MSRSADELFEQFQRSGSPLALAQVFDLLAPQLLLLAGHLVRDSATAEDVVQNTFLDAIEVAPRFDPRLGSVQRWLVGILVNNARKELRRRSRALDPARLVPEPTGHPEVEAAAHEFLQTVEQALAELPAHYRDVLRLGLLHGLDQQDIATSLDRPRETVKTQFRRGVDQLRALLPKGFALSVALAFTMGRGMASVRRTVLDRVGLPTPGTPAAAAGRTSVAATGAGAGTAWTLVAAGLLAVAAGATLWILGASDGGATARTAAAESQPHPEAPPIHQAVRQPLPGASDQVPAAGALKVQVRFARDRRPAAFVLVRARPAGDATWLRETEARSDASGTAELQPQGPGPWRVRGDRGGEAEASTADWPVDLDIPEGVLVEGVVRDGQDQPVAGAALWLASPDRWCEDCVEAGRTDGNGRFQLRDVSPGLVVGVLAEHWAQQPVHPVVDRGDGICGPLRFTLMTRAGVLEGVARAPDGGPARDVAVFATVFSRDPATAPAILPWRVRTDRHGAFRLVGVEPNRSIGIWVRGAGTATSFTSLAMKPGAAPHEILLRKGARLKGVVRAPDGDPVSGAEVHVLSFATQKLRSHNYPVPEWEPQATRAGPDGSYAIDRIAPNECELIAYDEQRRQEHSTRSFEDGEEAAWDARLQSPESLRGQVVDARGEPLSRWRVELSKSQVMVSTALTNDSGRFVFRDFMPGEFDVQVLDPTPGFRLVVAETAARTGAEPCRLVVPDHRRATAWITVRALAPEGTPIPSPCVLVTVLVDGRVVEELIEPQVTTDGLRIGPLPAGECELQLSAPGLGFKMFGPMPLAPGTVKALGDVVFAPAGEITVLAPGVLDHGKVMLGSVFDTRARFAHEGVMAFARRARLLVQPGSYRMVLWGPDLQMFQREVTVESGARIELQVPQEETVSRMILLRCPTHVDPVLDLRVYSGRGELLLQMPFYRSGAGEVSIPRRFAPGDYEAVVSDLSGKSRRTRFSVTLESQSEPLFEIKPP